MEILLSGLNSYLGKRAMSNLNTDECHVHGIARDLELYKAKQIEEPTASLEMVDLLRKGQEYEDFRVLGGIQLGIYITHVPTLTEHVNLNMELITLNNFIQLAERNGCQRIVYIARLMDKPFIAHIKQVLENSGLTYTIVLKNLAIGKGSVLDKYMHKLINSKYLAYDTDFAKIKFNPISALDLLRWISNVDWEKNFKNQTVEIGGAKTVTIQEMFRLYKKTLYPNSKVQSVKVPGIFMNMWFKRLYRINKEDLIEFKRLMSMEYPIDNSTWKNIMLFSFTPLEQVIQFDQ